MDRLKAMMDMLNEQVYNPVGLHLRWPRSVAFLFVSLSLAHHKTDPDIAS